MAKKRAFTFTDEGNLLVFPVGGSEVVPFWSSRTRLQSIAKAHPKYAARQITEYSLADFEAWLSQFESDGVLIGVNWSGPRLTGYNVAVPDLRAAMQHISPPSV
jgi:hypothetical protein